MARQKTTAGNCVHSKLALEPGNEFLCEGLSPGSVVRRVGKLVMTPRARTIEININHLWHRSVSHLFKQSRSGFPGAQVRAAETVDLINGGITRGRRSCITRRQHNSGAHHDRSVQESSQRWTLKRYELDRLSISDWVFVLDAFSQSQLDRWCFGRLKCRGADDDAAQIARTHLRVRKGVAHIQQRHDLV